MRPDATAAGGSRFLDIMAQTPTAREAIGLQELARQLRDSAAQTNDENYVRLFLAAAKALEDRAHAAPPAFREQERRTGRF